jgi:hypothetical protein
MKNVLDCCARASRQSANDSEDRRILVVNFEILVIAFCAVYSDGRAPLRFMVSPARPADNAPALYDIPVRFQKPSLVVQTPGGSPKGNAGSQSLDGNSPVVSLGAIQINVRFQLSASETRGTWGTPPG